MASRYVDVRSVLDDERFQVAKVDRYGRFGTIHWLRASVSRFADGQEHRRRRAIVERELASLPPAGMRDGAHRRTALFLRGPARRVDVMATLARRVPMATMASALGIDDEEKAAGAVAAIAAGYFPGCGVEAERRADEATALLIELLEPADEELVAARIALMVQGCDAIAGLIGNTLHLIQDAPQLATHPTHALLCEVVRHRPPVRASRRVARVEVQIEGRHIPAGDPVVCSIDAANHDPEAFDRPERFDPLRRGPASLTFGHGIRPCPGSEHAMMLAAAVIDAVRERCVLLPGAPVPYEPSPALRIPERLEVEVR